MGMESIHDVEKEPIDSSQYVAVVLGVPPSGGRHIGIWYRADDDGNPNTLHLAWHCMLENVASPPAYFTLWVKSSYPAPRLRQAAAYIRRVWTANGRSAIPYSFSSPNDSLDPETGAFLLGPTRLGLTCASFVLAVFHGARLPLINYATWVADRPGDREWQEWIIEQLESRGADRQHIEHLRSEIGAVRFRPEEVAAGAALAPPPADFGTASVLGEQIVTRLSGT